MSCPAYHCNLLHYIDARQQCPSNISAAVGRHSVGGSFGGSSRASILQTTMALLTYLGYIIWPIIKLAQLLIIIFWPFWRLLQILLLPFIHTTQFVSAALYYPMRLLGKFEVSFDT